MEKFDRVIVSTDCEEIAEVARSWGADIPFLRPHYLAGNDSNVVDTIVHGVQWLKDHENYEADYVFLFQPTTPLIDQHHIMTAIDIIEKEEGIDSVISVTRLDTPSNPYNIRVELDDECLGFWQEEKHYNKEDRDNQVFYKAANMWVSKDTTLNQGRLEGGRNRFIEVDWEYGLDIDFLHDLELIEAWLEYNQKKSK